MVKKVLYHNKAKSRFGREEITYISFAVGFAFVWFLLAIPKFLELGIDRSSPYLQFLLFNLGLFIFLQIFLKARVSHAKINLLLTVGMIAMIMALDVLIPPFTVNSDGELLHGPVLVASSTDYVVGYLALNLGLEGIYVFLFTYVLIPAILLFVAAHFLPNFVNEL